VLFKCQHLGGTCAIWAACVVPFGGQNYHFAMSFEALLHPLPLGAVHVGGGGVICCRLTFVPPYFLPLTLKITC